MLRLPRSFGRDRSRPARRVPRRTRRQNRGRRRLTLQGRARSTRCRLAPSRGSCRSESSAGRKPTSPSSGSPPPWRDLTWLTQAAKRVAGDAANWGMNPAWEALNQLIEGKDFDPPARLLSNIKPEAAVRVPAGAPYSVATNVAHTDIWNRVWLNQIEGKPRGNPFPDFPVIEEAAWAGVRERFLEHLVRARELAETQTNSKQVGRLIQIAVHTAYHVGQIK